MTALIASVNLIQILFFELILNINYWLSRRVLVVYAVSVLALMEIVDLSIVSIVIPQMLVALNTNLDSIAMVSTFYVIAATMFNPLTGFMIERFSFKNVILGSALVFAISSILCGMSNSLYGMMLFRFLQGLAGAFLPSTAQAYITANFKGEEQNKMMTIFSSTLVLGPIISPIMGAYLAANLSWRFVFYVNAPICFVGFIMVFFLMQPSKTQEVNFDKPSLLYLCFGIGLLEYFIDQGDVHYWFKSTQMIWIFFCSMVFLFLFIHRGIFYKSILNLTLFRYKNFVLINMLVYLFFMISAMIFAYVPTLIQKVYGYPVEKVGLLSLSRGIAVLLSIPFIKFLLKKIGHRETIFLGVIILIYSCWAFVKLSIATTATHLIFIMCLQAIGMLFVLLPLLEICFLDIPQNLQSEASGVINFFRNFAVSSGTAFVSSFLSHQLNENYIQLRAFINPMSLGFQLWEEKLIGIPKYIQLKLAQVEVLKSALLQAYHNLYLLCASLFLLVLFLVFFVKSDSKAVSFIRDYHFWWRSHVRNFQH